MDDPAVREDIVQEAIAKFFLYQAKSGIAVTSVSGLLRRISLDLARDYYRRRRRSRDVELSDDLPCQAASAQQQLEQRQLLEIIVGVVKGMPRLRREVFFRRRLERQSAREVAEALGISPGAVDAHIARAVLDLHRTLEKIEKRGGTL
ncbi:sigma-70 family RNA polymerase sigma factor [Sphingomonas sp. AP4-R1]|uniref:RNA polymerase sigma factor n=1 Tax=Sphingomonas sp. AP4-R1 TaxID=2735134 RepID=UPI001493AE79|nr:sigma-70 family RNA polymerase sigma factor [Sphingomonas sp. AP4-R1]QJU59325.1 sigma-70 family RNA polymerase sigma factor [Sphingomonas sp. AP4-R1]